MNLLHLSNFSMLIKDSGFFVEKIYLSLLGFSLSIKVLCHPFYVIVEIYDGGHFSYKKIGWYFFETKLLDFCSKLNKTFLWLSLEVMATVDLDLTNLRWWSLETSKNMS